MAPSWLVLDDRLAALCDDLGEDPAGPLRLCLQAPGGYGKSALTGYLAGLLRENDVPVADVWTDPPTPDAVAVADDAHLLDEARLTALHRHVTARGRVVLAYRPWPRPAALAPLVAALRRERPPVLLGPFTEKQTRQAVRAWAGESDVDGAAVHRLSGGVPGIAHRLTGTLTEGGSLSDAALLQFRADLDHLDPDVRRLLLATAAGGALPIDVLAPLLGRAAESVDGLLEAARATGLLRLDDTLVPAAREAVIALGPVAQRADLWQRLAALQLERGQGTLTVVRSLVDAGIGGSGLAPAFQAGGEEALAASPQVAARLFAAAAAGGAPTGARQALATALGGDLDTALRLADRLVGAPGEDPAAERDRAAGAAVAAAVLAHRGQLTRSAERYRWSRTATSRSFARLAGLVTGQPVEAAGDEPVDGPPTLLTNAAAMMADGLAQTLSSQTPGAPAAALATLVQAAALLEPAGPAVLLPDSPAALAALVALHAGELDAAESVLDRASAAGMGATLMARRHRLLTGWIRMVRGDVAAAGADLAAATGGSAPMQLRDGLFAAALRTGLARRAGDLPELHRSWGAARETVLRHPVDLLTLLPLGELAVAAARLGEGAALHVPLGQAFDLLERLGRPALWSAGLRWYLLQAAVVGEDADAAGQHAKALAECAVAGPHAAVLASAAASWCRVLVGDVDPDRVAQDARELHRGGLSWDAARLAGQAAARTADRKAMVTLLDCARLLQGRPASSAEEALSVGRLSGREQEVAELLLEGLTYKEIGDRLFITPKTVEHHVARMRARLGAPSRAELLAQLRAAR